MDIIEAKRRIIDHMIVHHMEEEPHCHYITEALHMAINALGAIDQIRWERDIAIEQLNELGLSLGQKIDGIYLTKEELLKYKKVSNLKHKPYTKVLVNNDFYGACAIYEKHPFGDDNDWCWVYYDWCGNPVGLSKDMPKGEVVDKFTAENLGSQSLADYLNKEPAFKTS